jgi:two-component system alkaline phosphatase synthesis response regulator PhoP
MANILIIEDEKDITEAIEYNLSKEGYKISKAFDGTTGFKSAQAKIPDLIILDLMLPGMDGFEVCKQLKKDPKTANLPIIILTAKSGEVDKVLGLELGADDYITKPFSMRELVARVKTVLKRYEKKEKPAAKKLGFANVQIDLEKHEVTVGAKLVELTAKEFSLLQYLVENEGRAFSREHLLDHVWGIEVAIETRTVDVHIKRLREKLGKASDHILTLRGVGYKFKK